MKKAQVPRCLVRRWSRTGAGGLADDGREFALGGGGAAAEPVVGEEKPDDEPEQTHGAGADEGSVPSPFCRDGRDEDGGDEGGGVGAGVEEAGGEGTLFGGEPLGGGLDGGGEVAGFAEAEKEAGDAEAEDAADERVAHGGSGPDADGEGVADLGAQAVDDAAGEEVADAVGDLEDDDDVAEVVIEDRLVELVRREVPAHERSVMEHGFDVERRPSGPCS